MKNLNKEDEIKDEIPEEELMEEEVMEEQSPPEEPGNGLEDILPGFDEEET